MANVAAYIIYQLLWIHNEGTQPGAQAKMLNMQFDGGIIKKGKWYFGYLRGAVADVAEAIEGLKAWNVRQLTQIQAINKLKTACPEIVNITVNPDGSLNIEWPPSATP